MNEIRLRDLAKHLIKTLEEHRECCDMDHKISNVVQYFDTVLKEAGK